MDELVEAITHIANHPKVIEATEPHVAFHLHVDNWATARVLFALGLLIKENDDFQQRPQGDNKHPKPRRGESVH
jgi:hypothetical protein